MNYTNCYMNVNSTLFLHVHSRNKNNNFVFKGCERFNYETIKIIESEVVNSELQKLLFDVITTRNYTTNEIKSLIEMIRKFHNKIKRKILKLIIGGKLHLEILPKMLKKLHKNFNFNQQVKMLSVLKNFLPSYTNK